MIETLSGFFLRNRQKFSENVRERSSCLRTTLEESSEIFEKSLEIFGKSSKTSSLVCLYNKQSITCTLVDIKYMFSCSTRYLKGERSIVRYHRVRSPSLLIELNTRSRIKLVSTITSGHVISSVYLIEISHIPLSPPPPPPKYQVSCCYACMF